jgi:hypothetical protein
LRVVGPASDSSPTSASAASTMRSRLNGSAVRGARRGGLRFLFMLDILRCKNLCSPQTYDIESNIQEAAMESVELIGLLVPVTYLVMLAIESAWPAPIVSSAARLALAQDRLSRPARHRVHRRAPAGAGALAAGASLDRRWPAGIGGGLVGIVLSGLSYAWHRLSHAWTPLWLASHQIHHSPQRIDIAARPCSIRWRWWCRCCQLFVTVIVLGLDPLAAALVGYVAAFRPLPALERGHAAGSAC